MKMKKIAAVLLALSVLAGCSGNTVTEEAVTTTAEITVTEDVTVTSTEDTEAVEITATVTEAEETSKPRVTPPGSMFTKGDDLIMSPEFTVIDDSNEIVDETVEHIEINAVQCDSKYTELSGIAMLLNIKYDTIESRAKNLNLPSSGTLFQETSIISFLGYPVECPTDPKTSFVKGWGCTPSYACDSIADFYEGLIYYDLLIDLTNSSPESLYEYIDNNTPVMVWVTEGLAEPELFAEYEGNKMYNPKECVVLAGYSDTAVCVWSPIEEKYVTYDRALFEQRYAEMGSMALTVVKE